MPSDTVELKTKSTIGEAFAILVEGSIEQAVRRVFNEGLTLKPRCVGAETAGAYLSLSEREVYNMIADGELPAVRRGKRKLIDLKDLDDWIDSHKR